jgi:hypothetical protein
MNNQEIPIVNHLLSIAEKLDSEVKTLRSALESVPHGRYDHSEECVKKAGYPWPIDSCTCHWKKIEIALHGAIRREYWGVDTELRNT